MSILGDTLAAMTAFGCLQSAASLVAVARFALAPRPAPARRPAVTILKPVCGAEPGLEQAIASFCAQDYPAFQLVIGAQDPHDPALLAVRRVQQRFPHCDITVVVDTTRHGVNRKIGNLINMLPRARHDMLVIADSDLHAAPDYLDRVVEALLRPGIGLVTTVGCGEAAAPGLAARLGASHISHIFLPGALFGAMIGRQDCLGGTMALSRQTLRRVGGLPALARHLADDNVLGVLVRRAGLGVAVAHTVPVVTVQERSLRALWQHELRWSRTIGAVAPIVFAGTLLQYPLVWSLLAVLLSGCAPWAMAMFATAWALRAATNAGVERCLRGLRPRAPLVLPLWALPLRDVLSVAEILASYWGDEVVWRGHTLHADPGARQPIALPAEAASLAQPEEALLF